MAPFVCGDTGSVRDLDHIIWKVRLTVLLQLVHWKLRASDTWTVLDEEDVKGEAARRLSRIQGTSALKVQM